MNYDLARFNMIEQQIRPWEVLDAQVLKLLSIIKREDFVPQEHSAKAFADMELPLTGGAMGSGKSMLAPKVQARLVQELTLTANDHVLEIGTGSGFTTALLGALAKTVISLEIDAELAAAAKARIAAAGLGNVQVLCADGSQGWSQGAPYDCILLGGSVQSVPEVLKKQLSLGGRLLAIVGDEPMMRATLVRRVSETDFVTSQPWDTVAPRLQGFAQASTFVF